MALVFASVLGLLGFESPATASTKAYCHALKTAIVPSIPPVPKTGIDIAYVATVDGDMSSYMKTVRRFVSLAPSLSANTVFQKVLNDGNASIRSLNKLYTDLLYLENHPNDSTAIAQAQSDRSTGARPFNQLGIDIKAASKISKKLCPGT